MGQLPTKMGIIKGISVQSYIEKVGLDDIKGVFQPSWFCKSEEQIGGEERVLRTWLCNFCFFAYSLIHFTIFCM